MKLKVRPYLWSCIYLVNSSLYQVLATHIMGKWNLDSSADPRRIKQIDTSAETRIQVFYSAFRILMIDGASDSQSRETK